MDKFFKSVGWSVAVALMFIVLVPFTVLCGWLTGVILKLFCGNIIAAGMNLLFNTNRFTPDIIPYITATLSCLVGYFQTRVTVSNN
jgi:hypothetical protein